MNLPEENSGIVWDRQQIEKSKTWVVNDVFSVFSRVAAGFLHNCDFLHSATGKGKHSSRYCMHGKHGMHGMQDTLLYSYTQFYKSRIHGVKTSIIMTENMKSSQIHFNQTC